MDQEYERVYTVNEYYDGPRGGVADFQGVPHVYASRFDDGYPDTFQLMPIDRETLQLVLEDWAIWKRWETAFHAGDVTLETHPALTEDRRRHEELKPIVERALIIDDAAAREASGDFVGDNGEWRVRWIVQASA